MTVFGLVLVLAAAFCHATWNLFVKRINGGPELVWLFSAVSVAVYFPLAFYVTVQEAPSWGAWEAAFVLVSVVLHLAYFLLLQQGYRRGDLSLVYPTARATGPLLATLFAVALLDEAITPQIGAGGLAIVVGVLFLTGGQRRGGRHVAASLTFGLGAGLLIGSYTVWDSYAVATLLVPPLLLDYASSVGRVTLLAPVAVRRWSLITAHWQGHRLDVVAIAIFNPLAYILVLYALTFTPVVYVAPIREVSVLITVVMGSLLLGEADLGRRLAWASLILIGVVLLVTA